MNCIVFPNLTTLDLLALTADAEQEAEAEVAGGRDLRAAGRQVTGLAPSLLGELDLVGESERSLESVTSSM